MTFLKIPHNGILANISKNSNNQNERMNAPSGHQVFYLRTIQQHIAPVNLADELAKLLSMSRSAAYRRVSGESLLNFDEMTILLQHYPVSLETQLNPNTTRFNAPFLHQSPQTMTEYLDSIECHLSVLANAEAAKIQYVAHEIPFFHYLFEPDLAVFKMYMWSRTVWRVPAMRFESFDLDTYRRDAGLQRQIRRLSEMYASIPSEEIWNSNMLDITLNQIRHCCKANRFKTKQEAVQLFKILRGLIRRLRNNTEVGEKMVGKPGKQPDKLKAWYNELLPTGTFILATINEHTALYLTFESPNFIQNHDATMCTGSVNIFENYKTTALDLNGDNEVNRTLFFERMTKKVDISTEELDEFLV